MDQPVTDMTESVTISERAARRIGEEMTNPPTPLE